MRRDDVWRLSLDHLVGLETVRKDNHYALRNRTYGKSCSWKDIVDFSIAAWSDVEIVSILLGEGCGKCLGPWQLSNVVVTSFESCGPRHL